MVPARAVGRSLHVQPVIHAVHDDLCLSLRLHVAAQHAERDPRYAILRRKARNNGLERAFARRIDVRVPILEREKLPTVLEHEAESIGHQP